MVDLLLLGCNPFVAVDLIPVQKKSAYAIVLLHRNIRLPICLTHVGALEAKPRAKYALVVVQGHAVYGERCIESDMFPGSNE